MTDTICAISTPSGIGGIAVIRISGPDAIAACSKIFRPFKASHTLEARKTHTLTFGQIVLPKKNQETSAADNSVKEEILDEVVISLYRAPHSFTGEDVVEISCHGSTYIQQQILSLLCNEKNCSNTKLSSSTNHSLSLTKWTGEGQGSGSLIRLAEPGEFTRRAFTHGRFDLSQAEAVADLISAQSAASHRLAMQQMKGSISQKLTSLHDQLLELTSLLELELDFSEEDVEFADRTRLINLANEIDTEVTRLADTFQSGQAIKNGIPVAIIGAPNVGKSTLLNALLKEDRAIVSDIQGTTRDLIEDTITLGGYLFRFIDTAGIRTTDDRIEQLGIDRSRQAASRANIIILLTEPGVPYIDIEARPDQHVLRIENKTDQFQALTGLGLKALEQQLIDLATPTTSGDVILTNHRHYQALTSAHQSLLQVIAGLNANLSGDLIAEDLRTVIASLNEILGKGLTITSQSTLNQIFSRFCIGK